MGERGFTLVEVLIATVVIGVLSLVLIPATQTLMQARHQRYVEEQDVYSQRIANTMIRYADERSDEDKGRLPAPYDGYMVADPDGEFYKMLMFSGLSPGQVNHDGREANNVRVYQRLDGETTEIPLFKDAAEPEIKVEYDYGVIYMTNVPESDAGNPEYGDRGQLNDINDIESWADSGGDDLSPRFVSTRTLQKNYLRELEEVVRTVRSHILQDYRSHKMSEDAQDIHKIGHIHPDHNNRDYMESIGITGSSNGCYSGWYDLPDEDILEDLGLNPTSHGKTPWGQDIEYCPVYTVQDVGGGEYTSYAALRLPEDVSDGSGEIIISF